MEQSGFSWYYKIQINVWRLPLGKVVEWNWQSTFAYFHQFQRTTSARFWEGIEWMSRGKQCLPLCRLSPHGVTNFVKSPFKVISVHDLRKRRRFCIPIFTWNALRHCFQYRSFSMVCGNSNKVGGQAFLHLGPYNRFGFTFWVNAMSKCTVV